MAVLYRVNAQSALFEEAMTRAGIPFRVRGGERFLERQEVQVALDALRSRRARGPAAGRSPNTSPTCATDAESVAEERREHVDALVRLGHEYLEADGGRGSVDGFLEFLQTSLRGDDAGNSSGNAVELLTFHRAKGLEFDTVFVTGLEKGLVPISHAKTSEAMDEEQRLLYVALSRAERGLHLTWARERTVGRSRRPPHPQQLDPARRRRRPPARARHRVVRRRRARAASPARATVSRAPRAGARAPSNPPTSPSPTRRSTRRWSTGGCACRAPPVRRRT